MENNQNTQLGGNKGFFKEDGTCEISVRGHSNAIYDMFLPPEIMKMVDWKDGDRVEIVKSETYVDPSSNPKADFACSKVILGLSITKVDDAKLLDESDVK